MQITLKEIERFFLEEKYHHTEFIKNIEQGTFSDDIPDSIIKNLISWVNAPIGPKASTYYYEVKKELFSATQG